MSARDRIGQTPQRAGSEAPPRPAAGEAAAGFAPGAGPGAGRGAAPGGTAATIGELVAIADAGRTPLVLYPGQPGIAALPARSTVDLHAAHVGRSLVLLFEAGDPMRPIVVGVLRQGEGWPLESPPGQVQVDADGERMIVSAREQLVLRCGQASVTLTRAGHVLIQGTYVSSRSSGVNRIKGGSVQLN